MLVEKPEPAAAVAFAAGSPVGVACLDVAEGFELALVRRTDFEVLSPNMPAVEAGAAVPVVAEVGAEEARCQVAGSVAAVAASGREAAHSAVVGHLVEEGSAVAVVAAAEPEAMMAVEDKIDRLAEAQSTAADPVVGHIHLYPAVEGRSFHLVVGCRILTSFGTEA